MDRDTEAKWEEPKSSRDLDIKKKSANYCGFTNLFVRNDVENCENCQTRPPFYLRVEITNTVKTLRLNKYNARLKVYCVDPFGKDEKVWKLSETKLPKPYIR